MSNSSWDYSEKEVKVRSWVRSPSQTFQTGLSTEFRLVCEMERVSILEDGSVSHEQLPSIIRSMSQVYSDVRVQQLAYLLRTLIEEWKYEDNQKVVDEQPITDINFET